MRKILTFQNTNTNFSYLCGVIRLHLSDTTMLINFTVGNYRSFKDQKTLSMEATAITELKDSLIVDGKYKLLPSAVLYGANSSGKSNFLKAIDKFRYLVTNSSKLNSTDKLEVTPFLLNKEKAEEPSFFEIELLIESVRYRYGFTVDNNRIFDEWLYAAQPGKREKNLFIRTVEGIGISVNFPEGKGLEEKTRDNALFLSTADSFNGTIAGKIVSKIDTIYIASGILHEKFAELNALCHIRKDWEAGLNKFLKIFDLGFDSIEFPEDKALAKEIKAYTIHNRYDDNGEIIDSVRLNMKDHESSGTNKLFDLASWVLSSLLYNTVLVIDELDSKLHPILTKYLINLFNDPETNKGKSQLIFATHDTNLLNTHTFRRDQIWFTEKDKTEATDLYSLVEFRDIEGNKIRKDRSIEKDYINGRYGAIPYIKNE